VTVEGLTFRYTREGPSAVDDIGLGVHRGEIVVVVGPSGSGKTTLLRLVTGLLRPSAGRIDVQGQDITGVPPERRPVALVFQGFALFPHLDVGSNIAFGLRVRKVSRTDREARVREVSERLGIEGLLRRRPGEISGGERQRVALARALVRDPMVFCLDEPLSSLDPLLRAGARRDLDEILRQEGRCALWVTHDQAEAMTLADRVAVMRDGRIEQFGTPRELYDTPATEFVASFIGSPPMSVLPAGTAGLEVPAGAASVGVRPEHVRLVPGDAALIVAVDDLGHERIAELDVGDGVLLARVQRSERVERGQRTGFVVDKAHVHAFDATGKALG
jgi:sn-glycerol 3-phosphate transport system ATP-binding protein